MIRAIIFDCFGVLLADALQTMHDELQAIHPAAAIEVRRLVAQSNCGELDHQAANNRIAELFGLTYEVYRERLVVGETRNQLLFSYILELRQHYKIGMLSNAGSQSIPRRFTPEELNLYFDTVVVSAVIGHVKPEAEAYHTVARELDVLATECLFIDDQLAYCAAAEKVGMKSVLYLGFPQCKAELEKLLANSQ